MEDRSAEPAAGRVEDDADLVPIVGLDHPAASQIRHPGLLEPPEENCVVDVAIRVEISPEDGDADGDGEDCGFGQTERVGFEPTIPLPVYRFSRPAPSATRTPLLADGGRRR